MSQLLDKINTPEDLRRLRVEELPLLCDELRREVVNDCAVNPGHFASSLGALELTVALHYVFDTPEDRIVWDVGHQAYPHKILTGRREAFKTNRKLHGLKPFPSPEESEYDTFTCGHASNSISAALGMAVAARLSKDETVKDGKKKDNGMMRHVVAVIGDGAMSGGLAFEGLNNVSSSPNDLLIILNDNNMSIDRSVGGMKQYLLNLNTNQRYNTFRMKFAGWMGAHGWMDEKRKKTIIRLSNAFKSALSQQQNIFEGMNIRYFGPVDGNNVIETVRVMRLLKDMKGPKLLHLHTVKGHGYKPAEEMPTIWHAPGVFDPETGKRREVEGQEGENEKSQKPPKFQTVFGETLLELARQNPKIVGVTPAMPTGCSMNIMMEKMPSRTFDVGIAEGHAVTFSGGMAKDGLQPFCNIYSAFAQRAYDNIIHDVATMRLPVVLCFDRAGLVGEDGPTHHGAFDMAALRPVPNLTICSPMDEHELRHMMYTAQLPDMGTWVIRYPRGCGSQPDWKCPMRELPVGKGRLMCEGKRTAVLTIGPLGVDAGEVAREENAAHYDMRFLKPLDEDILHEVSERYERIVTVEDGTRNGGLGSAVCEWLQDHGKMIPVTRLGLPDYFVEHGTVNELREIVGLDKESIRSAVKGCDASCANK
ncbi:1-deoxy-D-xylulose-5-phosphate synthase [Palleniella muris]|uniref:1-deoxy-D-xylulose-5-phosphate synthase n=1 Tax=Palleniella muris TaxID=3038145 RepID=A0AC61QTE6_9BACT|nr:1-deoxy-D-xylulose-5-phosphate synthase [Palleniella muris]TGX83891.1 1-deoxy-D-xylulose-5-phosphate synthase [Palleniella muris]